MNPGTLEIIITQLHLRIDELIVEKDTLQYEIDAIPAIKAERDELRSNLNAASISAIRQERQIIEYEAAAKLAFSVIDAFYECDEECDCNGQKAIAALKKAGAANYRSNGMTDQKVTPCEFVAGLCSNCGASEQLGCEGWIAPDDRVQSLADQVEALTKERDTLMTAAKLAWVAIVELRYSNSTDKSRSVSEFAVQAMRQAGVQ